MEDFGFKLQDIKEKYGFKKPVKFLIIILSLLLFAFLLFKIIQFIFFKNSNKLEKIPLIKSDVVSIKRLPDDAGGLVVENLDVKVYDIIDNKGKSNVKPVVNTVDQELIIKDSGLTDQTLLTQKINEINSESEMQQTEKRIVEEVPERPKTDAVVPNIKINSDTPKKSTTNINDLSKLGNSALINNIKEKKDVKPGVRVQLLALTNSDGLMKYWDGLKEKYAGLFADKNYYIEKAQINGNNTIYRLQVGTFVDNTAAANFCSEYIKITNKSKVDCIIVKE